MPWLLIFFLTPIAEMYLLIEVAGYIDAWPTIGLVMLTAVVGVALLKRQGLSTLTRGMGRLERGEVPATEMAEGILLAVAGAFLVTPGFITDTVGFVLLFPPSRRALAAQMLSRINVQGVSMQGGFTEQYSQYSQTQGPLDQHIQDGTTVEGDFERKP